MKYILAKTALPILEKLKSGRTLCAFDFDGTLAPIATHPSRVRPRRRTLALLARLCEHFPCIVISGRARRDIAGMLQGVPLRAIIGNHGAETEAAREPHALIRSWRTILTTQLADLPGVWVEDKGFSLAVHYRQARRKRAVHARIMQAAQTLSHAHIFGGKQVVNIAPVNAPNKGTALAAQRDRLQCDWVLYVGDDDNDEAAFAIGGNLVAVRVGANRHSAAQFYLRGQTEVDQLMASLSRSKRSAKNRSTQSSAQKQARMAERPD